MKKEKRPGAVHAKKILKSKKQKTSKKARKETALDFIEKNKKPIFRTGFGIIILLALIIGGLAILEKTAEVREERMKAEEMANVEASKSCFKSAVEDCKKGLYISAFEKVNESLKFKPDKTYAIILKKKLEAVMPIVPKDTDNTSKAILIRKAVKYYIEGDTQSFLDIIAYVIYLNQDDDKLKELYKTIEKEKSPNDGPYDPGIDPVREKLLRALGSFYEGKFTDTIKLCNEALRLEPNNITALERMGSAYYKLGQKQDALKLWEKASKLNPDNKVIYKFIDRVKKEIQNEQDVPVQKQSDEPIGPSVPKRPDYPK